jgi:hypothetical protein
MTSSSSAKKGTPAKNHSKPPPGIKRTPAKNHHHHQIHLLFSKMALGSNAPSIRTVHCPFSNKDHNEFFFNFCYIHSSFRFFLIFTLYLTYNYSYFFSIFLMFTLYITCNYSYFFSIFLMFTLYITYNYSYFFSIFLMFTLYITCNYSYFFLIFSNFHPVYNAQL